MTQTTAMQVQTETWGDVPRHIVRFAADRVGSLLTWASEPVLFARVKLTMIADPTVQRPAIAQVTVDLNGRPLRAQAEGRIMHEAVDHACDRLRVQLMRAARHWEAVRGGRPVPAPGQWRHQSPPARRLPYYPRAADERDVVRRKSYALDRETPEEAAAEAELMDYHFHLFTERSTGQDSVICRTVGGYRLQLAAAPADGLGPVDESIVVSEAAAPRLPLSETAALLEASGQPFVFFVDAATGRGNVLYHRYDGHYGLIVPSAG
jgi:ribosome-associated translation inhibitor RaiA